MEELRMKAVPGDAFRASSLMAGAAEIAETLRKGGFEAYLVGGAPRDILLGLAPQDIDIATSATPEQVESLFERTHRIGASFGVVTVVARDNCYEVATFREERDYMDGRHPETVHYTLDPRLDVIRRDFTVNGLLLDPRDWTLTDYVGGVADLKRGVLRCIGEPSVRFAEDYLRIMRAVRFCVRFRLEMDAATKAAIPPLTDKLNAVSAERLRDELTKMLLGPDASRAFRLLLELGILKAFVPELAALDGLRQPPEYHPEGDVFTHTMLMLDHMAQPSTALAWAILLHDIGKTETFSVDESGTVHFYGHEDKGATLAAEILERFKFSRETTDSVVSAVRNHMKFAHVHLMRPAKWRRMVADANFPIELELHRIDCISCHAKLSNYILLLDRVAEMAGARALPHPVLNGRDLIALGMKPGPAMGKALSAIADLQLEGIVGSREAAIETLRKMRFIK